MRKRKSQDTTPVQPVTPVQLLTITEVAASLKIGRTKVYGLLKGTNSIPSVKVGSATRVTVDALNTWVKEQAQAS